MRTASAVYRRTGREYSPVREESAKEARGDRLLPWIAAERAFRSVLLLVVGVVLITHPHTDWSREIQSFVARLGLNPQENWVHKLLNDISRITSSEDLTFGLIAIAYGALEGVEAYGLFTRRRWAEWLTVFATSLLLIPELWALSKGISLLKAGGLAVNIAVVAYLLVRLRRR